MPGTPGQGIRRVTDGPGKLSVEDHKIYRSGVGMLLYLVKHLRPDIANAVRELSKALDGATQSAFKEMKRVIKFVLDMKTKGLKLEPIFGHEWFMEMFLDSEYGDDKDTRISV